MPIVTHTPPNPLIAFPRAPPYVDIDASGRVDIWGHAPCLGVVSLRVLETHIAKSRFLGAYGRSEASLVIRNCAAAKSVKQLSLRPDREAMDWMYWDPAILTR